MSDSLILTRLSSRLLKQSIDIFPWNANFNTGLPEIDEQHRNLVHILNVLASHVGFRSDSLQLTEVFDALMDYTVYHFNAEEIIWGRYFHEDPEHREHLAVHERFVETVRNLKGDLQSRSSEEVAREALDFLARWLASHILEKDRYLAYQVLARKAGACLEDARAEAKRQMGGATRTLIDIILSLYSVLSSNTVRLMRELEEHRKTEEAFHQQKRLLEHREHFDGVTGLPNRTALTEALQKAMARSRREQKKLVLVYLDLDGFRSVNDAFGPEAGNAVLEILAKRMCQRLKDYDTVARLGGDEFVMMVQGMGSREVCLPWLNELLIDMANPVEMSDKGVVRLSASLGVTFYPQQEDIAPDQLIRQADQAMYQAKIAGKNRIHFFDMDQDVAVRGYLETTRRIQEGLIQREFVLYYQPKVNLRSGKILGVEALIRWQHPERGLLAPKDFLHLLAGQPLECQLGEWVLDEVMVQMRNWQDQGLNLAVSVNVSGQQLLMPGFASRLQHRLAAQYAIAPDLLELEILETSALEDINRVSRVMEECLCLGVRFSIDDFGTGYSSLDYLKRLPARILKIDKSFVMTMLEDPDDLTILVGILGLAEAFRRQVIAEGVETLAQQEMLLDLGCEEVQGYAVAYPMKGELVPDWTRSWVAPPSCLNRAVRSRDDIPRLMALVEQQAWNRETQQWVKGNGDSLAVQACRERFENWLIRERGDWGSGTWFDEIYRGYEQVVARAGRLATWQLNQQPYDADEEIAWFSSVFQKIEGNLREVLGFR